MTNAQRKIWTLLKERRFTTTARILGDHKATGARVEVIDNAAMPAAWWNPKDKQIVLNNDNPKAKNAKDELIWERAKLYHELFHVLFTTNEKMRGHLHDKSRNKNRYLWLSNALEDGRIEFHGAKVYEGTVWYIRTLLRTLVTEANEDAGLLLYVRAKIWRNATEAKFWAKYQKQIDAAIVASKSDTVWQTAFDIVEDIEANKPPPPKRCPDCGAVIGAVGHGVQYLLQMAMSVCPTCGTPHTTEGGEGEGEGEKGGDEGEQGEKQGHPCEDGDEGDTEGGQGKSEDEGDNEGNTDTEGDNEGGSESPQDDGDDVGKGKEGDDSGKSKGGGHGAGKHRNDTPTEPPTDPTIDKDALDKLNDLIDDAMDEVDEEVSEELVTLEEELATYVIPQEYLDSREEQDAYELTEVFAGLLVESNRQKYVSCKRGGRLNTRRLIDTQTGGDFMQEAVEKASQPHIVLCIDESGSMMGQRHALSAACRVLNGAMQDCGAKSSIVSFGVHTKIDYSAIVPRTVVPVEGFACEGYSTPTGAGLRAAHDWLDAEGAKRGLVIVVTDGAPSNPANARAEFESLKADGYFVIDVLLGKHAREVMPSRLQGVCHEWIYIENPVDLIRELETPLDSFLSGAI